jgi:hypothetical protein
MFNIIRKIKSRSMRWLRHVARIGEKRNAFRLWGRQSHRRLDNIEIDPTGLTEIREYGMGWTNLVQGRHQKRAHMNTVMNIRIAYNRGNFVRSSMTGGG